MAVIDAVDPTPVGASIVIAGSTLYPIPALLTERLTNLPLPIAVFAVACTNPLPVGGSIVTPIFLSGS